MTLTILDELEQGSPEWLDARRGIVTASVVGQLITTGPPSPLTIGCDTCLAAPGDPCVSLARKVPTALKTVHDARTAAASILPPVVNPANNDTSRALTLTLAAERITGHTESVYVSADMERGTDDEPIVRDLYSEQYAPASQVGFMVEDKWGFRIGYSPDGLVGKPGLIEIKSPRAKNHFATILADTVPAWHMPQIQCGLLISGREWCDFVSYRDGWPLFVKRVYPDPRWFAAIVAAVTAFEDNVAALTDTYHARVAGLPMTERIDHNNLGLVF